MSLDYICPNPPILSKIALYVWLLSLCLPALHYDGETYFGYETLVLGVLFGWIGLVFQAYSNLTFLLAIYLTFCHKNPIELAAFTFILGLSTFLITSIVATGDKGTYDSEIELKVWGVGCWIGSYTLLLISTVWYFYSERNANKLTERLNL